MRTKIAKTFIYKGFGFPIKLINVPMKKVFGEWAMDINFNKLRLAVLDHLLHKTQLLNGDEIKFIRKFLNMTTTDFGNIFKVSHVAVMNWEKGESQMSVTAEIYLRLYILDHLRVRDNEFREFFSNVSPEILKEGKEKTGTISINIDEELKTA